MIDEIKKEKILQSEISSTSENLQKLKSTYNSLQNKYIQSETQKHLNTINLQSIIDEQSKYLNLIEDLNDEIKFYSEKMKFKYQKKMNFENLILFKLLKKIFQLLDVEDEIVWDLKWLINQNLDLKVKDLFKQLIQENVNK